MDNKPTIRQQVADILNALFADSSKGVIFKPEDTIKRTGAGKKHTKYDLKTSQSWSVKSEGNKSIWVSCVGMTMAEFIKEYFSKNIYTLVLNRFGFEEITIYKNQPEWKTVGYVLDFNKEKESIKLHFSDLLLLDEVEAKITKATPEWLFEAAPDRHVSFYCKIYQGWRTLNNINGFDWGKIWKTFKFDSYLSVDELDGYP